MPTGLQILQAKLREEVGEDFAEASDHRGWCRCSKCWNWWRKMGPDPDTEKYGPFTDDEIKADTPPVR